MMEYVNLGDVATYINGYAFKPEHRGKKGLPIIRIQDLNGNSHDLAFFDGKYPEQVEINTGDILISWSGSLGVYKWNKGKALLNQHIFKVLFNKIEIDKEYFCYAIRNSLSSMSQQTHGATMKHITKKDFDNISIPYPDLIEQKKIANNLNIVNKLIMFYEKELILFEQMVKARFIEMFGSIHNSKIFVYYPLKEITTVCSGGTPNRDNKAYWESGTIPWVKTTELKNNRLTHVEEFITELGLEESSAKLVPSDTVLVAMYGQGKTRGMTGYLEIEATTNQACACILPTNKMNMIYLWKYFELSYDKLRELAKGGNQPNLNCTMIRDFNILVPPIELQNQYADFVRQVDKSREDIKKALEKTQQLYDSLMQEYFG